MQKQIPTFSDEAVKTILDDRDTITLARWSCTLNEWEWPEDMPGKPPNFNELPWFYHLDDFRRGELLTKMDYIDPLCNAITERIGEKEELRYHHLHNLGRTDEQFEHWWKLDRGGDVEGALDYYLSLGGIE